MGKSKWKALPGGALIALGGWLAVPQGVLSMESQEWREWSEVSSLSLWEDGSVRLLAPSSTETPSKQVPAKTIAIRIGVPPRTREFRVIAVSDPGTGISYVMRGAQVIVSDQTTARVSVMRGPQVIVLGDGGLWTIELAISSLNVFPSYARVPAAAGGMSAAVAQFAAKFSPGKPEAFDVFTNVVELARSAPPDFFSRETFPTWPSSQAFDVDGGQLRISLRSYDGRPGTFWVDVKTWKVTRTNFSGHN